MAASTIVITVNCAAPLVHDKHASHPENFPGLGQAIIDFLSKELGPDAGQKQTLSISSITVS